MEIMRSCLSWLSQHWDLIAGFITTIASVVIALISLLKNFDSKELQKLLAMIPSLISYAEKIYGAGNGDVKKVFVLESLRRSTTTAAFKKFQSRLDLYIENVLTAPQKKS